MKGHGCTEYVTASLFYEVHFPVGQVSCALCDFSRSENAGSRYRCCLTGEILPFYSKDTGLRCPLVFNNDQNIKEDK